MKTIEVIVSPAGETRLQTTGFLGGDCLEASRQLEAALGRSIADRLTAEYFQAAHVAGRLRTQHDGG